jgi:hypothetical protein
MSDNPAYNEEREASLNEEDVEELFASEEEEVLSEPLVITEEAVAEKYTNSQLRIVRTNIDYSLHSLRQSLPDDSYINMSPLYQRRNRWDQVKRSQLIESFLMNIPVPPIFLFENAYNQYEVMDGRQRLDSIKDFLNNLFPLRGLEFWRELNGQRFGELPLTIQMGLLRRTLSAVVLLAETSRTTTTSDDAVVDVRMVLFKRLNTGGVKLNPQELRNALYPGHFNAMLIRSSRSDIFTKVWRIPAQAPNESTNPSSELLRNTLFRTMGDCEIVLRFFAVKETVEMDLRGSLRKLLDGCMQRHINDSADQTSRLEELFLASLRTLNNVFDEKPFALPGTNKLSVPLYDALMVATYLHSHLDIISMAEDIKRRLSEKLANRDTYDVLVGKGNTVELIKQRVRIAEEVITG